MKRTPVGETIVLRGSGDINLAIIDDNLRREEANSQERLKLKQTHKYVFASILLLKASQSLAC